MRIASWDLSEGVTVRLILGALLHVGFDEIAWRQLMAGLSSDSWDLKKEELRRGSSKSIRTSVRMCGEIPRLTMGNAEKTILNAPSLPESALKGSLRALRLYGKKRGAEHESYLNLETLVELVGVHVALDQLGVSVCYRTPFSVNSDSDITLLAMLEGEKIKILQSRRIEITHLGVALMLSIAQLPSEPPSMTLEEVGCGSGEPGSSSPENVLTVLIGEAGPSVRTEPLFQVETTIDDMNPELYPPILVSLRKGGALDVWWSGATTRTGRPGATIFALVPEKTLPRVIELLLEETTTIGVRFHKVDRCVLPRKERTVRTSLGKIQIKESILPSGRLRRKVELRDCLRLAEESGRTIEEVRSIISREIEAERSRS